MGRYELEYPKDKDNSVKRYNQLASYSLRTIHGIVNSAQFVNVSFNPPNSPFPVILPMIGQMGSFDRPSADEGDPLDLYVHGYVSSRLMNLSREGGGDEPAGMPVCASATHVDGLVLALSSFSHNYNYRSAVLFGHATLVQDPAEKLWAMELITNSVVPDRWRHSRLPVTPAELQSTALLKVKVASASSKVRDGQAEDPKADLDNEDAVGSIWTGVLPVYQTIGEPLPGPNNKVDLPGYIADYRSSFNEDGREHSLNAANKK
ncbi:unnamed protein product [Clonostachys solani]|uniref:Flavin-nucleotide-binding protein n=1 Tax=Clonostachys solani TaxID=160281 RepID=A0A9N9ZAR6_9HYPO|nr:unnamed protein product [Clonostachys solani]